MIRRRGLLYLVGMAALAGLAGCAGLPRPLAAKPEHVFIVSFDGGRPDVMQSSTMPLTMKMARRGSATWNAQTVFPPITLVSHVSMLTGVLPAKHHVDWNSWAPERGPVSVPTIFQLASAKGYRCALFAGKEKFRHLDTTGALDRVYSPSALATQVASEAAAYIVSRKPNLCFIHFPDSDGAGHSFGWGSREQVKSFEVEDTALRIVWDASRRAGIEKSSTLILTADHGGHDKGHGEDIPDDMTIPWIAFGSGVKSGTTITDPVMTCDTAATALWLLGVAIPAGWDGKPVLSALLP